MTSIPRRSFLGVAAGAITSAPLIAAGASRTFGPNDTLGVGLIGVGNRGSALLKNLLQIPGVSVRAICDVDAQHLERGLAAVENAGQKRPAGTTDGTWKDLLAKDGIDAIVSAIPCDLHAHCYLDMIAAGKDLYGEKPMCLNRADLDAVVKAARVSKQIVQIGHQRRADPHFIEPIRAVHERRNRRPGRWPHSLVELLGAALRVVRPAAPVWRLDCRTGRAQLGRAELGRERRCRCGPWRWDAMTCSGTTSPIAMCTTTIQALWNIPATCL